MSEPIVETEHGKLRGQLARNDDNGFTYFAFKGVPYAKPPVGDLRFSVSTILFFYFSVIIVPSQFIKMLTQSTMLSYFFSFPIVKDYL